MKRLLRTLLVLLVTVLCTAAVYAADASVTKMDFVCEVDRHGNYDATITAEINFTSASDEIIFPLGENVKRISLSGGRYTKKNIDGIDCVVLKNSEEYIGLRTFVISYKKHHAVTLGENRMQTLCVELLSPLWEWPTEQLQFAVTLPREFYSEPTYLSGYYADAIAVEDTVDGTMISGSVPGGLMDRESLVMNLKLPARFFSLQNQQGGANTLSLILMGLLLLLGIFYWYRTLRNPPVKQSSRKLSPDGLSAWEFPYVASGGKLHIALLAAEWGSLGYLRIRLDRYGRVNLAARMPMGSERRAYEQKAFRALFRRDSVCYGDTQRSRRIGERAGREAKAYWDRRIFSRRSGNPALVTLLCAVIFGLHWFRAADFLLPGWSLRLVLLIPILVLGVLAGWLLQRSVQALYRHEDTDHAMLILILAATVLLAQFGGGWAMALAALLVVLLGALATCSGGLRTEAGMELSAQIRAFRRYLRSSNPHHLQLMLHQDGQYFYDILPYAEAMGMGRRFARSFANIPMEPCAWLTGEHVHYRTALEFYDYYRAVMRKMQGKSGRVHIKERKDGEL